MTDNPLLAEAGVELLAGAGVALLWSRESVTPPVVDDGGAGDGALGEEMARRYPLRPKKQAPLFDARGIPREWQAPGPPPIPPEWKAPTQRLDVPTGTLRDLAPLRAVRVPKPPAPPQWLADDEDELELLLLA